MVKDEEVKNENPGTESRTMLVMNFDLRIYLQTYRPMEAVGGVPSVKDPSEWIHFKVATLCLPHICDPLG
jgi:hypothetical protein